MAQARNVTDYEYLGIDQTASEREIIDAFRKKSKLFHPDRLNRTLQLKKEEQPGTADGSPVDEEYSKKINKAYENLMKPILAQREQEEAAKIAKEEAEQLRKEQAKQERLAREQRKKNRIERERQRKIEAERAIKLQREEDKREEKEYIDKLAARFAKYGLEFDEHGILKSPSASSAASPSTSGFYSASASSAAQAQTSPNNLNKNDILACIKKLIEFFKLECQEQNLDPKLNPNIITLMKCKVYLYFDYSDKEQLIRSVQKSLDASRDDVKAIYTSILDLEIHPQLSEQARM